MVFVGNSTILLRKCITSCKSLNLCAFYIPITAFCTEYEKIPRPPPPGGGVKHRARNVDVGTARLGEDYCGYDVKLETFIFL